MLGATRAARAAAAAAARKHELCRGTLGALKALGVSIRRASASATSFEGQGRGPRPEILWAPGGKAEESQTDRLAGKIGVLCRDGEGLCVVGARGELPAARVLRAVAKASERGKSAIEFRVRWQEEASDERSLRFYTEIRETWREFKRRWAALPERPTVLIVTPKSNVHRVATAAATEQRYKRGVALKLDARNDSVLSTAAKVLATMPHMAQSPALGASLVCVARWPSLQKSGDDVDVSDAARAEEEARSSRHFIFIHVFARPELSEAAIETNNAEVRRVPSAEGRSPSLKVLEERPVGRPAGRGEDLDSWARRNVGV